MLSTYQQPVWVGLNPEGCDKICQGYVMVEDRDERSGKISTRSIPMLVRPSSAVDNGLSLFAYRRVIAQLRKMGVEASSLEIRGKHRKFVYSGSNYTVLYNEPLPKPNNKAKVDEVA